MKIKIFSSIVALFLLLTAYNYASAQSLGENPASGRLPVINITDDRAVFSFEDLRYDDRSLVSPIDVKAYVFSVPPNWKLVAGGEIELQYDVFLSGADLSRITGGGNPYGGNLIVNLNGVVIGTIPFNEPGTFKTRLQIPIEALTPSLEDGRHLLTISLDAQLSCTYDIYALVTIKSTSLFDLPFEVSSPKLDLANLPAPFYLESSFVPDSVLVIVPDNPDVLELQAAMNVMAGFGSAIEGDYDIRLVNVGSLTELDLAQHHLIFVGMPAGFSLLSGVNFQLPIANGKLVNLPQDASDDGVLQMALSPWNSNKALMLVTGTSGAAVLKAGLAVSSNSVVTYGDPLLVYVSDVQKLTDNLPIVERFSLKSLGYARESFGRFDSSADYVFYVSKDQVLTRDGYVEVVYYHSSLPTYDGTSFSLRLNGEEISTIGFKEETQQVTTLQIKIPPGILRFGENTLEVRTGFLTIPSCDDSGFREPWLTISDETNFYIPAAKGGLPVPELLKDFKFFPELFTTQSDLGDTAFVLSKSDPVAWGIAGDLSYEFGATITPSISNLLVAYADDVPQQVKEQYSIIAIGRASASPFVMEINENLPAPFDFMTDTASERQMQIIYRIPPGVNVGYLELLPSPFNNEKAVMVVSGNSDVGMGYSAKALLMSDLQSKLAGVFVVTNGTQIATGTNALGQFSIVGTGVPDAEMVVTTPIPGSVTQNGAVAPPMWFVPALVASGVIILIVIAFVIKTVIDRRRLSMIKELKSTADGNTDSDDG